MHSFSPALQRFSFIFDNSFLSQMFLFLQRHFSLVYSRSMLCAPLHVTNPFTDHYLDPSRTKSTPHFNIHLCTIYLDDWVVLCSAAESAAVTKLRSFVMLIGSAEIMLTWIRLKMNALYVLETVDLMNLVLTWTLTILSTVFTE